MMGRTHGAEQAIRYEFISYIRATTKAILATGHTISMAISRGTIRCPDEENRPGRSPS